MINEDTFCILPFIHLYSNTRGIVSPCCISERFDSKINLKNSSIEEVYNTSQFKKLRKELISGIKSKSCSRCWQIESKGLDSYRNYSNGIFGLDYKMMDDGYVHPNFKYIDIRFSNICNFKCIMCTHESSSSHWTRDLEKKGIPKVLNIKDNMVSELEPYLSDLQQVYFAGGEPLIMKEHYEMLNLLHSTNRNIKIEYTTNLSLIKGDFQKLVNLWRDFKSVHIQVSLDGLYDKGESIRVGMKTDVVLKNIKLLQLNKIDYTISFSVANYNIYDIFDFYKELISKDIIITEDQVEFGNYVLSPIKYSIQNINDKKSVIEFLDKGKVIFNTDKLKNQIEDIKSIIQKNLI